MVFQDSYGSLNPCLTVGQALSEALRMQARKDRLPPAERRRRVEECSVWQGFPRRMRTGIRMSFPGESGSGSNCQGADPGAGASDL